LEDNLPIRVAGDGTPGKRRNWRKSGLIALIVISLASAGTAAFLFKQNQDLLANPGTVSTKKNSEDTKRILEKLSKVMVIQETEKPTVARVTKPELLKTNNKTFYKDVQSGDYLILYPKRAIIYREKTNIVVNVAPIINASQLKAKESPTPTPTTNSKSDNR
jgi:hypothetical protein